MPLEIERKFLVKSNAFKVGARPVPFRQGYLAADQKRTVRVRIAGEQACVTIKGRSVGISRAEYEYGIPVKDAREMLEELCERPLIEKTRYFVEFHGHTWEVDEFEGQNAGLVVAEIELSDEVETFDVPEWIDREVTADHRYSNASLVRHPYNRW
jgi:adenylate cyclase